MPWAPREQSVPDPGYGLQLVGRGRGEAEELEIGRDLLEQHVGADLDRAASLLHRAQEGVISCFITTSPTKVPGAIQETSTGSGSPSFMPSGVALTTIS
jgi:hypothetical protein